jgi:glutamate-ammonia-ligase adenylyltransferase
MVNPELLLHAQSWSGYLRRRLAADPEWAGWLMQACRQPVTPAAITQWFVAEHRLADSQILTVAQCRTALRKLRDKTFCCLITRDLGGLAALEEVVMAMTTLAELAVAQAYRSVAHEMVARHGLPRDAAGRPQEMLIVGMGKLGGCELNVSSDIDLVVLYGEEGETDGARPISHHEFYGHLTRQMMPVIAEIDEHGHVFRCDLRLRPDGDAGPLAWSLNALENYLIGQGREWERYAWLKARPIKVSAFEDADPTEQWRALESLRRAFVYRKYFDFDALAALRGLRERIRQDWQRRALGRSGLDSTNNIKLGDGGIREIEFVVQLSQLIRGGRMPALQARGLLAALHAQQHAGLLSEPNAQRLEQAYRFLRRCEHALQYREDEQTHLLPAEAETRAALARALRLTPAAFEAELARHRKFVAQTFRNVFRLVGMEGGNVEPAPAIEAPDDPAQALADQIRAGPQADIEPLLGRAESLLSGHRVRSLPDLSRRRLEALLPAAVRAAQATSAPLAAAARLFDLIETVAQRSAYLALLAEYPDTLARLARMMAASPWAAQYLTQHPLLLDSLIDWRTLFAPADFQAVAQQLHADLDACVLPDGAPDIERQMNLMRDVQRQISFQLLAQDLEGELTVEKLADQLSALADMLLSQTILRVWPLVNKQPTSAPRFATIAYGKLGGKELGYASDLDLVFVYDDARADAAEVYGKLSRRMASWLSTMTSSGRLYDVDLRLRPDGEAGVIAVPMAALRAYQTSKAWVWEHQALTRARAAAGDAEVGAEFETLRRDIIMRQRDPDALRNAVHAMRDRVSMGHRNPTQLFDVKHDRGGMVDVEFTTQYLVLAHAHAHPGLTDNLGNISLLKLAAEAGLINSTLAAEVGDAYRTLRRVQHQARLQGREQARVEPNTIASARHRVTELWMAVFGATPASTTLKASAPWDPAKG